MQPAPANRLSYNWQAAGKNICVDLSLDVVDRIRSAVLEPAPDTAERRVETGGLLLGRTRRDRELIVVEILDFEPFECEHVAGPSYLFSGSDRKALEQRLGMRKAAGALAVVGLYRSHTRRPFAATPEDLALMSCFFRKASDVLLLIHAYRNEPLAGGFIIWEGRDIRSCEPYLEFPFERAALRGRAHIAPTVAPPAAPKAEPKAADTTGATAAREAPLRNAQESPMRSRPARALPVIIVLMAIASSFVWLPGSDRTPVVHVSGRERAAVSLPSPEAQSPEGNRAAEETPAPIPPAVRAPEIPPAMADRVLTDVTPAAPVVVPMAAPMARATSEPVPSATTELPAELEEPPEVPAAPPPATESLPRLSEILSPAPVALPARFVTVEMDVADRPSRTGFLHGLALGKRRDSGTKFIAPKPLRDNTPEVPAELRRRIAREVFIAVKVFVDRTGKVEFAELLSDGTGPNRELAMLSVFSSRRWQFSPAQVDGVPVPAEVVLRFHFTREARPVE